MGAVLTEQHLNAALPVLIENNEIGGIMKKDVKVLVACGAGIATSTVVMKKLEDLFKENNINVQLIQIKIAEAASRQKDADMLVSTSLLPTEYKIPAIIAMGYLTGVGKDKLDARIVETAQQILKEGQ